MPLLLDACANHNYQAQYVYPICAEFLSQSEYMPSEPHGEGRYRGGICPVSPMVKENIGDRALKRVGKGDAVWRLTARRHSPLHNNERRLIDNFAFPLGAANQSVLPEWNSNAVERLRAICESRCRSFCMLRRMNTGLRDAARRPRFRQIGSSFG